MFYKVTNISSKFLIINTQTELINKILLLLIYKINSAVYNNKFYNK